MLDKNGREIKTGDIVVITGGFFKADNGRFRVIHSPGDPDWYGKDYCLERCNKNGTPSNSKYRTAFWPIDDHLGSYGATITKAQEYANEHDEIVIINDRFTDEVMDFIYPD